MFRRHKDEAEAQKRIAEDLLSSGLRQGGVVLVHSSLRSMGRVPGGPETVIRGLLDALGPEGTLLLPALSYNYVTISRPYFDVLRTPSNVGAIPEHFRTRKGSMRSVNPTHSVCGIGPLAGEMLGSHHLDETPCGPRSPFRSLRDHAGQILLLGCGMYPNTSMHGVEETVLPPYLFGQTVTYRIVLDDRTQTTMRCRRHGFAGWRQRYDRLAGLLEGDELKTGNVLDATTHIVETPPMWEKAAAAIRRQPYFFVEQRIG